MRTTPGIYRRLIRWALYIIAAPFVLTLAYLLVPPPSTLMLADIATLHWPKRDWVPLSRISPALVATVVASEDSAFCDHFGFDFKQIDNALDNAKKGRKLRGASTITQQVAKNLFLWNGRSWVRKALEAPLTLWIELVMPKRRILEIYLNIVEWGPHVYGAEAAAQHHFNTSAAKLSQWQAALLAASLPNPHVRKAGRPGPGLVGLAADVEVRAFARGSALRCIR